LSSISKEFTYRQETFWDEKAWHVLFSDSRVYLKVFFLLRAFFKRLSLLYKIPKYDIIFIHREVTHVGPPVFEWIFAKIYRKKIIYDYDDAIWKLNYSHKNPIVKYFKATWKVKYICKWAKVVSCGNQYLADYAKQFNSNVVVIPTTIDMNYHKAKEIHVQKTKLNIGWTGTLTTLKQINLIVDILKKIENEFDIDILIISNEEPQLDLKSLKYIAWNKTTEIEDLQKIDIGIMPLYDTEWEKGKCGFKGLQYMALAIPTIMSPVGVNPEIINDGYNGYLANSNGEWYDKIKLLINDEELRKEIGLKGQETIKQRYSTEANTSKYLDLLNSV
jgi:glycosyltransferase involved in cell wall biosynthesis